MKKSLKDILYVNLEELLNHINSLVENSELNAKPDWKENIGYRIYKIVSEKYPIRGYASNLEGFSLDLPVGFHCVDFSISFKRTKIIKKINHLRNGYLYEFKSISVSFTNVGSQYGSGHFENLFDFLMFYSYKYTGETFVKRYNELKPIFNLDELTKQQIDLYNFQEIFIKSNGCMFKLKSDDKNITYLVTPSKVRKEMLNGNLLVSDQYGYKKDSIKKNFNISIKKSLLNENYVNYLDIEKEFLKKLNYKS